MKETEFYRLAHGMINDEAEKIEKLCASIESASEGKDARINEYKAAKSRLGGILAVSNMLFFCNKHRDQLYDTYYLLLPYYELVKDNKEFLESYERAREDERSDVALYYGAVSYIEALTAEKEKALEGAVGDERKKLLSYLDAYRFAKDCIKASYRRAKKIGLSPVEIEKALAEISISMCNSCAERISQLPETARTEKKAIQIEAGMYSMGFRAAIRYNTVGSREQCIRIKSNNFLPIMQDYPRLKSAFEAADDDERQRLTAALYGEVWLISQYQNINEAELEKAKASGDVKKMFELNIKVQATKALLSAWSLWREQNGVYSDLLDTEV